MQHIIQFLGALMRAFSLLVVLVAVYLWVTTTSWGSSLPQITLAGQATATPLPVTSTPIPTATQTATATATQVPTMTPPPTATPYVVTQDAIVRSMRNEWQLTTQSMIVDSHWQIDTRKDRSAWDKWLKGTLQVEAIATYEIRAGIDLQNVKIAIAPGNRITITLPAPTIDSVAEDNGKLYINSKKDGVQYIFGTDKELDVALTKQIGIDTALTARSKACQRGILMRASQQAIYIVRDLVSNINPLIRYQDITVITTAGVCR